MTTLDDSTAPDPADESPADEVTGSPEEAEEAAPAALLPTGTRDAADDAVSPGEVQDGEEDAEAALPTGPASLDDASPGTEADVADGADGADAADDDGAEPVVLDEDELLAEDLEEEPAPKVESPYDRPGRWYVVHTQSGYENKVRQNLEARIASMNMEGRIFEIVIPMEDVVEFKNGKKVTVKKKMFPGYLLVRCRLDDDSWYVIRNTPGIVNFVGAGGKPSPLSRREVETFLQVEVPGVEEQAPKKSKARFEFDQGETVRVKEGPFADFSGEIVEINEDQLKVKVLVNIFGRETPVELEFAQVARL